jgi:Nif-specific regulatory protein
VITLEILQGASAGRTFELDQPAVTIGRAEGNVVALADYHLSGEHGQLFYEDDQVIYRDLRSTNGSAVQRGDKRIVVDGTCQYEITIHDGDRLLLGDPKAPVIVKASLENVPGAR